MVDQGLELLKLYLNEPPPSGIITVEQRVLFPLRNGEGEYLETPLLAFVDLIIGDLPRDAALVLGDDATQLLSGRHPE